MYNQIGRIQLKNEDDPYGNPVQHNFQYNSAIEMIPGKTIIADNQIRQHTVVTKDHRFNPFGKEKVYYFADLQTFPSTTM